MRRILEGIKDLIYDSIDYIIMLCIIGLVVVVIGWRLDILFTDDLTDNPVVDIENNKDTTQNNPDNIKKNTKNLSNTSDIVKVIIPTGSLPSKIASILEAKGLISSTSDFIEKSEEMNLDTKLKSGNYEIKQGSNLKEIVEIIAK